MMEGETTMYEEFQGLGLGGKALKRPTTLAVGPTSGAPSKKQKQAELLLTSPDLDMLKMTTPELNKFILANCNGVRTPTPNSHVIIPKSWTEEQQENFSRGFIIDDLNRLHQLPPGHHQDNMARLCSGFLPVYSVIASPKYSPISPSVLAAWKPSTVRQPSLEDSNSNCSNSNSAPVEFATREEPQTVPSGFYSPPPPSSPPVSKATDTEDPEQTKLERKRYRNRLAASKCRQRKLDKISQLEDKVKELEGENARLRQHMCHFKELEEENARLREHACHFKELERENATLRQQMRQFKGENAHLPEQACHFREQERENANLRQQMCQFKGENAHLPKQAYKELERENATLRQQMRQFKGENAHLPEQAYQFKGENAHLPEQAYQFKGENAHLPEQACHFREQERENANLRQQMCQFKEENTNLPEQAFHFKELERDNANPREQVCHFEDLKGKNAR